MKNTAYRYCIFYVHSLKEIVGPYMITNDGSQPPLSLFRHTSGDTDGCNSPWLSDDNITLSCLSRGAFVENELRNLYWFEKKAFHEVLKNEFQLDFLPSLTKP